VKSVLALICGICFSYCPSSSVLRLPPSVFRPQSSVLRLLTSSNEIRFTSHFTYKSCLKLLNSKAKKVEFLLIAMFLKETADFL